jgi:ATP-dependent protease ClpP protease subunit
MTAKEGHCLILAALFILTASCGAYAEGYQCSGSLTTDMENVKRARSIENGTFVRLDKDTLKFEGHINRGTYAKYLEAIDDEVKTLIINSSGGDSYDGVRVGLDMAKRKIDVIVDGVAASSAANYLFTAGKHKTICRGFVGFHGNAGAIKNKKALARSIRASATNAGASREHIAKLLKETMKTTNETAKLEKELFSKLGISQKLFDVTQTESKGLAPELNLAFEFLLPSIKTMKRFGMRHVEGRQDVELAERLGLFVIYY